VTIRHIGIDFDNTIVCYDDVFYKAALERNLIPVSVLPNKTSVRDFFRASQREDEWTQLQGYIYGSRMDLAHPFPGIALFFAACQTHSIKISIISHKTKHPFLGPPYDLHAAALQWLSSQSFFTPQIDIYFELTLQDKLQRIAQARCDLFIDDLPELLNHPSFPSEVRKVLFDPINQHLPNESWTTLSSWEQGLSILSLPQKS
jgi:hypothetical protein